MMDPRSLRLGRPRSLRDRDDAVSPVVATLLLVMLAVVTASGAYVYMNSSPVQTAHPTASFHVTSCKVPATVGVQLVATDRYFPYDAIRFVVGDRANGTTVGSGGSDLAGDWPVGTSLQVTLDGLNASATGHGNHGNAGDHGNHGGSGGTVGGLVAGHDYELNIVHDPTGKVLSTLGFRCWD